MNATPTENKFPAVLITGASGFLGKRIVEELLSEDSPLKTAKIKLLDIKAYKGITDPKLEFIQGDVRDVSLMDEMCKGVDIVIHSAAIIDWGTKSKQEVLDVNVEGSISFSNKRNQNEIALVVSLPEVVTPKL